MADAFSAGFREFCGGIQHAVSLHRILLFYLKSRLICVSSVKLHGKPSPTPVTDMVRCVRESQADEMYRAILVAFFLLQTVLSYLIPVIGPAASFIHLSWLYSLYCFEYKWSLAGWSLERRLAHLEQNWAYFAGFGSPFTLATFFVPNFVSKGIFALLFPVVRAL
ncbi:hypothetical protein BBJ28_00011054 [Nothophytophthora sp. Chile5]|nr:hypothetical protein BBJ28_00011054 [Nothophytophthora sp. Chile5]